MAEDDDDDALEEDDDRDLFAFVNSKEARGFGHGSFCKEITKFSNLKKYNKSTFQITMLSFLSGHKELKVSSMKCFLKSKSACNNL